MIKFLKIKKLQTLITISFILLFAVSAAITIMLVNYNMKQSSLEEAANKVNIISDAALSIHTYYGHQLKPALFKDFESSTKKDYFRPEWMSSTYAVREVLKYFKTITDFDYYYKECAINARSPENEADEFEKKFISGLNNKNGPERLTAIREYNGKSFFVSLKKGESMEKDCLKCHTTPDNAPQGLVKKYGDSRSFNRRENEVVSAISVRIPLSEAYEKANHFSFIFSIFLVIILLMLLLLLLWLNEKLIFSRLKKLRDKTDRIAGDHSNLKEIIDEPFGIEISELTSSFNRMSSIINDYLTNLEHKVDERTKQLKEYSLDLQNEISDREKAEKELTGILEEKEVLLKEIHHRVKNNFIMISNFIGLKTSGLDENSLKVLDEINQTIKTMSKIHELFYKSEKITNINIGEYLNVIIDDLLSTFNQTGRMIKIKKKIENIYINLNQSVTCGLLINEIITNSIKYAFPRDWAGDPEINISMKKENDFIEISIGDNGCGIKNTADKNTSKSLGLNLILMLPKQLKGSITTDSNNGTHYIIRFPVKL
jgi:two-component sensor histidine kinase